MSDEQQYKELVGPAPVLSNFEQPTDADLALFAAYTQRIADNASMLASPHIAIGQLQWATMRMTNWLVGRSCEIVALRRERDQLKERLARWISNG